MLTVNSNIASLVTQRSLSKATDALNNSIRRMSTGLKVNDSIDNPVGLAIATKMDSKVSCNDIATQNSQMGVGLLTTAESILSTVTSNLIRIRDLSEQTANGVYGSDSIAAVVVEIQNRLDEITRIAKTTEFNGKFLLDGSSGDVSIQVGTKADSNGTIRLDKSLFADASSSLLLGAATGNKINYSYEKDGATITGSVDLDVHNIKAAFLPTSDIPSDAIIRGFLSNIDNAITEVDNRRINFGAASQRVESIQENIYSINLNLKESISSIMDCDMAAESAEFVRHQILQQSSATLLSTANQAPSLALNLL